MNITVVTTFNQEGLILYGQRFLDSFTTRVDNKIKLICYAENCNPNLENKEQITILNAAASLPKLKAFKKRYKNVSYANGIPPDHIKAKRPKDWHKEFKWDAVRFANKVYAIFEAANNCSDWCIWMDADTFVHNDWAYNDFAALLPKDKWITYVGRGNTAQTWPECGFYGLNLNDSTCRKFLQEFEAMYENAEQGIFKLEEWHDSYVFGHVLDKFKKQNPNYFDYTENLSLATAKTGGGGHPIINCILGTWIDHLKGARKVTKKSARRDLSVLRNEPYWQNI